MSDRINLDVLEAWCARLQVTLGVTLRRREIPRSSYILHRLCVCYIGSLRMAPPVPRELHPYIVARCHYTPRQARSNGAPHGEITIEWRTEK